MACCASASVTTTAPPGPNCVPLASRTCGGA